MSPVSTVTIPAATYGGGASRAGVTAGGVAGAVGPAGSSSVQPVRMRLGLVSRPPSGWDRVTVDLEDLTPPVAVTEVGCERCR